MIFIYMVNRNWWLISGVQKYIYSISRTISHHQLTVLETGNFWKSLKLIVVDPLIVLSLFHFQIFKLVTFVIRRVRDMKFYEF